MLQTLNWLSVMMSQSYSSFLFRCCSLLGVDKVIQYAVTEWVTDIRKNQLPGILGGVGPMHSVVQLCEFELPQYCNG